jgi:anti-sigma factor (TIGR02949 family)
MNLDTTEQDLSYLPTPAEVQQMERQSQEYNQCQEAVKRLNEYLSKELTSEEEIKVQEHLGQCQGCFKRFSFEETLLKTIRQRAQQVVAPTSLRERILGLLHNDKSESSNTPTSDSSTAS